MISAKDSLQFLIRWLDRFPRYKNREIYLTGESYAGHYVPQLAREIVKYNAKAKHKINLKGFMVIPNLLVFHFLVTSLVAKSILYIMSAQDLNEIIS